MEKLDLANIDLIIGLGNPGNNYKNNRHNIGFKIIDAFCDKFAGNFRQKNNMELCEITATINGNTKKIFLVKPLTYMNNSGQVISEFQKKRA